MSMYSPPKTSTSPPDTPLDSDAQVCCAALADAPASDISTIISKASFKRQRSLDNLYIPDSTCFPSEILSYSEQVTAISRRPRRFLAQPLETSTRSSKSCKGNTEEASIKATDDDMTSQLPDTPGRDSNSSNLHGRIQRQMQTPSELPMDNDVSNDNSNLTTTGAHRGPEEGRPPRRFLPAPVETVKTSSRRQKELESVESDRSTMSGSRVQTSPRKFVPQLIETAKRSFRRREHTRASNSNGQSEPLSFYPNHIRSFNHSIYPPLNGEDDTVSVAPASRFSYSSLLRRQENRRHSFRVPDLPAIPSDSSDGSNGSGPPSLSTSPSASSDESAKRLQVKGQYRESCDEHFSGYLLSLAARSAEKQLKEQALAAFPNEQVYQPVAHFAIDREDTDSEDDDTVFLGKKGELSAFRRESSADLSWELEYLRRHKEEAEMRGRAIVGNAESRYSSAAISARRAFNGANFPGSKLVEGWQGDVGLARMRPAASPPMLGDDLIFPQSFSPEGTMCENDHTGVYYEENPGETCEDCGGLWCASERVDDNLRGGLWMGTCRKVNELAQTPRHTLLPGIMTPIVDMEERSNNSLDRLVTPSRTIAQLPLVPLDCDSRLGDVDKKLNLREAIDDEFHDGFVTQIYNYLSLGYPCVARYYDSELSRISGISVEELRRDDLHTDAKGYVGIPEDTSMDVGVTGSACMRWIALRLYIHEWARQQPKMPKRDSNLETWGVRERRGSWAF